MTPKSPCISHRYGTTNRHRTPARGRVWRMPHGAWRRALLILLAAGQLLVLVAPIRQPPIIYDEGSVATGAARVLHGAVPYRDF